MKRRSAALVACLLLAAGCSSSGPDDGDSTPPTVAGQQKPGDSNRDRGASPSTSVAAPSGESSNAPLTSSRATPPPGPPAAGEPADAAAASGNSNRPGTTSTSGPASAAQLPVYRAQDFYHWRWSPDGRSAVSWRFTNSVPSTWRAPITEGAASWNAERRSLQYARPGGDLPAYPAQGCSQQQLESNGVHRAALDGPDGIVATTYSCIDATTAEAVSVQIVIDAGDRWSTGTGAPAADEYDLLGAVAHEFGHATGWEGHYAPHDPRCTDPARAERMCPFLTPHSTSWRSFGATDRSIFSSAY